MGDYYTLPGFFIRNQLLFWINFKRKKPRAFTFFILFLSAYKNTIEEKSSRHPVSQALHDLFHAWHVPPLDSNWAIWMFRWNEATFSTSSAKAAINLKKLRFEVPLMYLSGDLHTCPLLSSSNSKEKKKKTSSVQHIPIPQNPPTLQNHGKKT